MKTLRVLFLVIVSLAIVSCSNGDTDTTSKQYYSNSFHHVYNVMSGTYKVYDDSEYVFEFNYTDGTADVEIKKIRFADGMPEINMSLEKLKWGYSNEFRVISATDVIPVVNGEPMQDYLINSVKIEILDRYVGAYYEPVVNICFLVNNVFKVTAVQENIVYFGQTNVVSTLGENPFDTNLSIYQVSIDDDLTADIRISGAKFAQGMPSLDMEFEDIPVVVNSGYGYSLACDRLIPEINDTPYPNYEISNLSGSGVFSSGLNLSFVCNIKKTTSAGGVEVTPYTVNSNLNFAVPAE